MEFDFENPIVWATYVSFVPLVAGFICTFWRLVRGPTLPDRVVALDLLAIFTLGVCAAYTLLTGDPVFLDVALVMALVAFLSTVALGIYLERRMDKS